MTKNVVNLGGRQAAVARQPNPDVIQALEILLQEARDGQIQHLVAIHSDGVSAPVDFYVGSGEPAHVLGLIGGMELCKQTMLMEWSTEVPRE